MKDRHFFPLARLTLFSILFALGAVGYYFIEIAFRGFSHWSMALCGGICLCSVYAANRKLGHRALVFRALIGALIITAIEFLAGCILNLYLGWNIWNYSNFPINLAGQITPLFSALWFFMCIPICVISSLADKTILKRRFRQRINFPSVWQKVRFFDKNPFSFKRRS